MRIILFLLLYICALLSLNPFAIGAVLAVAVHEIITALRKYGGWQ